MDEIEILGIIAGMCTTVAALPQLIKAVRTHEVEGISPYMFMVLLAGLGCWTAYGIFREDLPIIIFNGLSFLLNGVVLILYYVYRK